MNNARKDGRYARLFEQISALLEKRSVPLSRMATIVAVLSHKMDDFFWTGFYLLVEDELFAGPYQGPLACQHLEKGKGVCWAAVLRNQTVIVPDVDQFPGHIACDSRSRSEIVVPLRNDGGKVIGVLDIDSIDLNTLDETDAFWLEKIVALVRPVDNTSGL